jgi:hypothetical protein
MENSEGFVIERIQKAGCRGRLRILPGLGILLLCVIPVSAQVPANNAAEIQALRSELKRIEARLDALESGGTKAAAAEPAPAASPLAPPTGEGIGHEGMPGMDAAAGQENLGQDSLDHGPGAIVVDIPHAPEMKIRGFGDVRAYLANQNLAVVTNSPGSPTPATQGGNSTFALGIMDLFITSKISPRFSYLTEMGFEADSASNGIGVDLERAQITYVPDSNLSITAGRSHAMLGYYNTAFHHGTWFQTTMDRPRFVEFEDSGGPLPIHNVGLQVIKKFSNDKLGLHLFGEVGNGKQTYSLFAGTTPANVLADHTGKSTNIGAYIRPPRFSGLQAGFDWYQAALVPTQVPGAAPYYHQNIYYAHLVYIRPAFEFMAEDGEIGDLARGASHPKYTSGGFAQVSRAFGAYRPFVRYAWMNPNFADPNNAWVGRWVGPESGVRWDVNTFVALKAEFDHYDWRNFTDDPSGNMVLPILHKTINRAGLQLAYTF